MMKSFRFVSAPHNFFFFTSCSSDISRDDRRRQKKLIYDGKNFILFFANDRWFAWKKFMVATFMDVKPFYSSLLWNEIYKVVGKYFIKLELTDKALFMKISGLIICQTLKFCLCGLLWPWLWLKLMMIVQITKFL